MADLSVVVPAFNEEESIGGVLDDIVRVLKGLRADYEVLVVDDGSTDGTNSLAAKRGVKVLKHVYNMGYGASLKTGLRAASGRIVLIMDGDGTYLPQEIPKLLEHASEYDMVVGARTGEDVNMEWYRRPAKAILGSLANYLSGVEIPDLNSGFRVMDRRKALEFIDLCPSGFSFTTTITLSFLSNDYTIKYVPVNYGKRKGKSKIRPLHDGLNFIILIIRSIVYFNPLKVFLPVSIALSALSVLVFLYSWIVLGKVMDITVTVIAMSSIQIALVGLLADMLAKKR